MHVDDVILNNDDDILKMLSYDLVSDCMVLKIKGKNPANYLVTPIERLDMNLKYAPAIHRDALLDVRNYLYKKDAENVNNSQ